LPDKESCITGRQAYFWALQKHWPDVLSSLRSDVLPIYKPRIHEEDGQRSIILESWERLQAEPERKELVSVIRAWGDRFRITEGWIFQEALDTLTVYSQRPGSKDTEWFWRDIQMRFHPRFTPVLEKNFWYPPERGWPETWGAFKAHMEAQFRTQLNEYRRMVESKFGIGKDMMARDAGWTARYQKGETAIEIAEGENLIGYSDPEQAVFKAISKFAKLISLRLRRRGERIRPKPSVSLKP
jgi:hypothetical protein